MVQIKNIKCKRVLNTYLELGNALKKGFLENISN